jgi:hypothetical protein
MSKLLKGLIAGWGQQTGRRLHHDDHRLHRHLLAARYGLLTCIRQLAFADTALRARLQIIEHERDPIRQ